MLRDGSKHRHRIKWFAAQEVEHGQDYVADELCKKSSMKCQPAVIRRSAPFAVRHERARVGEDSFMLTFLHYARLHRCVLRLWLSAGLAEIPGHTDVVSTRDDGLLDGALLRFALVAGFLLLRCRACRLSLSSDTRSEGRSGRPFVWRLAAVLSVDLLYIPD